MAACNPCLPLGVSLSQICVVTPDQGRSGAPRPVLGADRGAYIHPEPGGAPRTGRAALPTPVAPQSYVVAPRDLKLEFPKMTALLCTPHTSGSGTTFDPGPEREMGTGTHGCLLVLLLPSSQAPGPANCISPISPEPRAPITSAYGLASPMRASRPASWEARDSSRHEIAWVQNLVSP